MARSWSVSLVVVALLALVLLFASASVPAEATAKITCPYCVERGYSYMCKVPMTSSVCFEQSGEVQCGNGGCTCCRKTAAAGCDFCDASDDDEDM